MKKELALKLLLIIFSSTVFIFLYKYLFQKKPSTSLLQSVVAQAPTLTPIPTHNPHPTPILTVTPMPTITPMPILGERKTLVIMYNFQDQPDNKPFSQEEVSAAFFIGEQSMNAYYEEVSFNQAFFTGDVAGWYTIPYDTSCSQPPIEELREILFNFVENDGFRIADYSHLVYLKPYVSQCTSTASLGGRPSEMYLNGTPDFSLLIHEMGHNLSFGHADHLDCGDKAIDDYSNCRILFYGDPFSPMGGGGSLVYHDFHYNAFNKIALGWIPPANIQEVTASGNYTIYPLETATSETQVLKIPKPDRYENYYLEYRHPYGYDLPLPPSATSGALLHVGYYLYRPRFPACEPIQCTEYEPNTFLIDTHPETGDVIDSAFTDGTTFFDEINNITITQLRHDENSVTVSVQLPTSTPTPTPTSPLDTIKELLENWGTSNPQFDLNKDGKVNGIDFQRILD